MNKKIVSGIIGLVAVVGVAGLAASTTYARGGAMIKGRSNNATSTAAFEQQRSLMTAQRTAMDAALEAGDYTAWKAAADKLDNGRGKTMSSIITQANFPKFVQMHTLMKQADAIGKEIGLDRGSNFGPGMMREGGRGMMGFRQNANTVTTNQ